MFNNIYKATPIGLAGIIAVYLLLCFSNESQCSFFKATESFNSYYSSSIFEFLITIPDYDEQERIESITGLNFIMYIFYLLMIVINISFIWIVKQDESVLKIIIYGLYTSVPLLIFINIILLANHNTWSINHVFNIVIKGVGTSLLISLISVCIYSVKNVFRILKEERKSILALIKNKLLSPNISFSIFLSRVWIIITLLISVFFIGLFWI